MEKELSIIFLGGSSVLVSEDSGTLLIPVERTGNLNGEVSFDYSVTSDVAVADEDFIPSSGTLTFGDQQALIEIAVPIIDDNFPEIDETFNVQIGEPSPGAELGIPRTAIITITDNDKPVDKTISFSQAEYSVSEDEGVATITLIRTGSASQAATVEYSTVDDYARAGSDYMGSTSETLTFAPGETSKTFTVPIVNDSLVEIDEALTLTIENPAGAVLGAQNIAKLIIEEEATSPYTFQEKIIVSGLAEGERLGFSQPGPTAFDWSGDDKMFIARLNGIVRIFENNTLLAKPFIDIADQVNTGGQRGLLGLAVHPDFPTSPYVYLAFTYDSPGDVPDQSDSPRVTRLVRVEADPATNYRTALPNSEVVLLETGLVDNFHAAGALKFGADGALYFSHGDGAAVGTDPGREKAELLSSLDNPFGKMFRIDPLTGQGYPDNPFYNGDLDSIQSKIYNYGLRNPWRYALHPETNEPFIGDVGQAAWEEINRGVGKFFGWSLYEGGNGTSLRASRFAGRPSFQDLYEKVDNIVTAPIYAENHGDGAKAIVVGDFYTGTAYPEIYQGALFFTDYGVGIDETDVRALVFDEQGNLDSAIPFANFSKKVGATYMATGPDGKLYFANLNQGVVGVWEFIDSTNNPDNAINLSVSPSTGNESDSTLITITATAAAAVSGDQTVDLSLSGTAASDDFIGTIPTQLTIPDGQTEASFTVNVNDDTLQEGDETATFTLSNPSSGLALGATPSGDVLISDNEVAASETVLYRVNAGGAEIAALDGGLAWSADTASSNSQFLVEPGSNKTGGFNVQPFNVQPGPTVTAPTPAAIFNTERWDGPAAPEMSWEFPVPTNGLYEVRLFMGNGFSGTSNPGERVFDVAIEGDVLGNLDDIDLSDRFGHLVGGMITNTVSVSDGILDIDLLHDVIENPLINGIEIMALQNIEPI
ncbi:MAG: hypothetical protein GVY17_11480 [Cyanobacteria bacterium]|nr:hypothetical protein [Cyanobacteria bacterium GSL.Bin21]